MNRSPSATRSRFSSINQKAFRAVETRYVKREEVYFASTQTESLKVCIRISKSVGYRGRAFYKMFEQLPFGPIDGGHLERWIDHRMLRAGVSADGIGALIVRLARPRTQDIVHLARTCFSLAAPRRTACPADVEEAFRRIVWEESDSIRSHWDRLPASQQNVLRAVAAGETMLHGRSVGERFGLKSSAEVSQALDRLVELDLLVKQGRRYSFDSPFVRGWTIVYALKDLGIDMPITEVPT